jgi:hypothetical protein
MLYVIFLEFPEMILLEIDRKKRGNMLASRISAVSFPPSHVLVPTNKSDSFPKIASWILRADDSTHRRALLARQIEWIVMPQPSEAPSQGTPKHPDDI